MRLPFRRVPVFPDVRSSSCSAFGGYLFLLFWLLCSSAQAQTTTVSGTVYMPNGTNVLPHTLVYLTLSTPAPLFSGANCPGVNCLTAANAIPSGVTIHTYSAVDGTFTLTNVAENTTYTLVIQAGHWRRQFNQVIGTTPVTGLSLSMPSTHAQGDIPLIAINTGQADAAECVFRDLGLNNNEFTDDSVSSGPTLGGRIHLYQGDTHAGARLSASTPLETALMGGTSAVPLNSYDMVMFPCQGAATTESTSSVDRLLGYTSAGGRSFITHDSRTWLNNSVSYNSASFSGVADWLATPVNSISGDDPGVATVNTTFASGQNLAQWLYNGGYSSGNVAGAPNTGTEGQVLLSSLRWDLSGVNAPTQTWLTLNYSTDNDPIMQFSFNAPFGSAAAAQYGRVMFNEYHVENVSETGTPTFPSECPTLTSSQIAQEKILEYALFDLSNFVTPVILPTVSIAITTTPSNSIFKEGDTTDTVNVNVTNTSSTVPVDTSTVLTVQLPAGLTATSITDNSGGWICNLNTLTCTRTTTLAASASDAIVVTVSVAGDATGNTATTNPSVSATVASSTFSSSVSTPLTITLQRHAAVTWATPASIADGYALSGTQLDAVGNAPGTYVYNPVAGTVLAAGSHVLSVTFTPTDQVTYPGTATTAVTLLVTAPSAATASAPAATNFSSIPVGTASSPQTLTFTLITPGVIGAPLIVTQGGAGLDFADANTGTCDTNGTGFVYTAESTCTVNVILTPRQPGSRSGAVLLEDQSGNVLATAYVYGVGLGPQAAFDAGKIRTLPVTFGGTHAISGIATDSNGNLYMVDSTRCIVQEYASGTTTTLVAGISGNCNESGDGGPATGARFKSPTHLAINGRGDLYISDTGNFIVRKVDAITGYVSVVAGTVGTSGYSGDNGPATTATLSSPQGLIVDGANDLYIVDSPKLVRRVDAVTGVITTVAGMPASAIGYSGDGASATNAQMNNPRGIALDGSGNLYIADAANNVIRKVTASSGFISTVAGVQYTRPCMFSGDGSAATGAHLCDPQGVGLDSAGNLYVADTQNNVIRKVQTLSGNIVTLAGAYNNGVGSYTGDAGSEKLAGLDHEQDLALDGSGTIYLNDAGNNVIRSVSQAAGIAVFGTYPASTSSPAMDVTVTNNGNTTLTVSALTTTANFNLSGADTTCSTGNVATGASCVLGIEFLPTASGALTATTTLTDNVNNVSTSTQAVALSGTGGVSLTVLPSATTLTSGTVGTAYSGETFTATGGTGPYTYSFTGVVPAGLALGTGGVLSGTPTSAGSSFSFTVTATDSLSATGSRTYTISIATGTAPITLGSLAQTYIGSPLAATETTIPSGLTVNLAYTGTGGTTYGPSSTPPTNAGSYTVDATISDADYTGTQTGTLVIAKAIVPVTLGNLAQTYIGSPLPATSTTTPTSLSVGLTYTGTGGTSYGPTSTPPSGAGSYSVTGTISDANYAGSDTETLVIAKATTPVTLGNLAQTYTGSPLAVTSATTPTLSVGLTYTGAVGTTYGPSSAAPIGAGSYSVTGTISDANYAGSDTETLVIAKAVAPVTLSNLAQTYTGSPLPVTLTTTPVGLAVGLTYTGTGGTTYGPSSSAPTGAGSYNVTGTISDANYTGSVTQTLVVAKAVGTLTLSNLAQTYTGFPLPVSEATVPASLTVGMTYSSATYGPSSTAPSVAGSYTVAGTISDANYTGTDTEILIIAKAVAPVTLGSLAQTYTGSPLSATATTLPAGLTIGLTYTGLGGIVYGPPSTPPAAVGSYLVSGTISDTNYFGTQTGTLVISPAAAPITLGGLAQTYTGSPLAATATTMPTGLTVAVTYTGSNGTTYGPSSTPPTSPGAYIVAATINSANYTGTQTGTLVVAKATAAVTLGALAQTYTGSPLAATATTAPTGLTVGLTYTGIDGLAYGPSSTPPTAIGSYTVTGSISDANYTGTQTATLVISPTFAAVTLGNLTQTYTGSTRAVSTSTSPTGLAVALTYTGTNGTAYGPSATPPTSAGIYAVAATINNASYSGTQSGTLVVSPATAQMTLGNLVQTYTGSPLAATATTVPTGLTVGLTYTGTGGLVYGPSAVPPVATGSYTVTGTISDPNYTGTQTATMVIATATAPITLSNLVQTYTGSSLAATATTSPSGLAVALIYTGTNGTTYGPSSTPPAAPGSYTVAATINSPNYSGTQTGTLVISTVVAPITLGNLTQTYTGSPVAATVTTAPVNLPVAVTYTGSGGTTYGPSSTPPTLPGSYTVVASATGPEYTGTASGTLTIGKAPATVTLDNLVQIYTGSPLSVTAQTTPAGLTVSVTYNGSPIPPTVAGTYTVAASVGDALYSGSSTRTLVVSPVAATVQVSSNANPALSLNAFNLTATVVSAVGTPTGTVTFLNGTVMLGSAPASAGVATFSTSLPAGTYQMTAVYSGDTNHSEAASGALTEMVLDFSLTPTPPPGTTPTTTTSIPTVTAAPGTAATYQLSIVPTAGVSFPKPVTLTVSGAPSGSILNIAPASWSQLSATSWTFPAHTLINALAMTIQLPPASATMQPPAPAGPHEPAILWALLLLPFSRRLRRMAKRVPRIASLAVLFAAGLAAAMLTGCGNTSGLYAPQPQPQPQPQQQQTYIVTVTATSGTLVHSTQVSLTVK